MDHKKLDRLIKLAKLANHNSAEGEANSAARALARAFADDNYKWLEDAKKNGGIPKSNGTSSVTTDYSSEEMVIRVSRRDYYADLGLKQRIDELQAILNRPRTWDDVRRSQEAEFKSRYDPGSARGNPFGGWDDFGQDTGFDWTEYFREEEKRRAKVAEEERRRYKEKQAKNWTWTKEDPASKVKYQKEYKQHCRDCTVCKITRLTTDEETPYVCYECRKKR